MDEESWEDWGLDASKGTFFSNKIGGKCFYHTIIAVYVLSALWSKSYGAVAVDNHLMMEEPYIAWINSVLGTTYTNWRATQMWTLKLLLHSTNFHEYDRSDLSERIGNLPAECSDSKQWEAYSVACHLEEYLQLLGDAQKELGEPDEPDLISRTSVYASLQNNLK